jgi:predicted  nucleic acid-binding Zn-ribbon protein
MTDILALPFDQFQRYRLVADLVEKALGTRRGRVLDVGGRTELLGGFLKGHDIYLVDVEASDAKGLILGSGAALPFADDCFDAVCAFDTLEHVPVALRDAFVAECARVSRGFVFLAGPYDSPQVARSEELLQEFPKHKIGQPHRYLNEHRELGLPDREATLNVLRNAGGEVGVVGHANLERWLLAMCLEMYMESDPLLQPLAKPFYRFYNQMVFPHDHADPVYRHVVMASFGGDPLPTIPEVLKSPQLPEATEQLLQTFAMDWMGVDREHQVWKPEFQRLKNIIEDLEKDLGEHKLELHSSRMDLEGHKETLCTLRSELRETSDGAAKQEHELRTQLQAHAHQTEHLKDTLKRQSEESLIAVDEVRAHYEAAMEAARLQGEAVQKELGAELNRVQEFARTLGEDSAKLREHAAALEAERERLQVHANQLETERSNLQSHVNDLESERGNLQTHVDDLESERSNLQIHVRDLEAERERYRSQVDGLAQEVHHLVTELAVANADLAAARRALGSRRHALGRILGKKYED